MCLYRQRFVISIWPTCAGAGFSKNKNEVAGKIAQAKNVQRMQTVGESQKVPMTSRPRLPIFFPPYTPLPYDVLHVIDVYLREKTLQDSVE